MAKKIILDIDNEIWKEVKMFKIREELKNNNEAVVKLIRRGLDGQKRSTDKD